MEVDGVGASMVDIVIDVAVDCADDETVMIVAAVATNEGIDDWERSEKTWMIGLIVNSSEEVCSPLEDLVVGVVGAEDAPFGKCFLLL
ncbi:hypothetical protein NDU88_006533 [Pleurodeles waltl]|uniref:Uncharacterized protein n=1 Tax=Pleurodeles waltl TaxID=8319 RepID=A0AAV7NZL5_PLEWA|nr:hypothetical protein NDU88_006533 [Pleurodeles waltl]